MPDNDNRLPERLPHLDLSEPREEIRRAPRGGPRPRDRDAQQHGERLVRAAQHVAEEYARVRQARPSQLPELPQGVQVLLKTEPPLGPKQLRGLGLEFLEERGEGVLVVLSPDPGLQQFRARSSTYAQTAEGWTAKESGKPHPKPHFHTSIAPVDECQLSDATARRGDKLAQVEIEPDSEYWVDIELAGGSEPADGETRRGDFEQYVRRAGGQICDLPVVEDEYALFRVQLKGRFIEDLLENHPHVLEIDLPPDIEIETAQLADMDASDLNIDPPPADAPHVCVMDSGIASGHPLLAPAVDRQRERSYVRGDISTADDTLSGHGTAVAGLAAYGDMRSPVLNGTMPVAWLDNARILKADSNDAHRAKLDERLVPKVLMRRIVSDYFGPTCKIFNLSVGSAPYRRERVSTWAEEIDKLTHEYDILVVVSAGNVTAEAVSDHLRNGRTYPEYLIEGAAGRVRNPAHAVSALTVGSLTQSDEVGLPGRRMAYTPVAPRDRPSPFTRIGLGWHKDIKPDVVDYGGNLAVDGSGRVISNICTLNVPVANRNFAAGSVITFCSGTSFAAPRVAHLAAQILAQNPAFPCNLVRALIVQSAEWPVRVDNTETSLRLMGYGRPRAEAALFSAPGRVTVYRVDTIQVGRAHIFSIPFPDDLLERSPEARLRVAVTLAYNPPVRKTRPRQYRGIVLEWKMAKPEELPDAFTRRVSRVQAAEGEEVPEAPADDWPWTVKTRLRNRGTVQKDWFEAPADRFKDEIVVAVLARQTWAPEDAQQNYALVVTLEVVGAVVPIYERVQQRIRERVRVSAV